MIAEAIHSITRELPEGVQLVAVSKFHPAEAIREAYDAGQRIFGESHVQELVAKCPQLPDDIEWHFIGHLQTNKVRQLVPHVTLIHAIDSEHLLREVDKQARRIGRRVDCLLQLHVAQEETKFGFSPDEALSFLRDGAWRPLAGVRLAGIMCMASNVDDEAQIRREFHLAATTFAAMRDILAADATLPGPDIEAFRHISMGMSHDWHIAVKEGATLVRIGTTIFGERQY